MDDTVRSKCYSSCWDDTVPFRPQLILLFKWQHGLSTHIQRLWGTYRPPSDDHLKGEMPTHCFEGTWTSHQASIYFRIIMARALLCSRDRILPSCCLLYPDPSPFSSPQTPPTSSFKASAVSSAGNFSWSPQWNWLPSLLSSSLFCVLVEWPSLQGSAYPFVSHLSPWISPEGWNPPLRSL